MIWLTKTNGNDFITHNNATYIFDHYKQKLKEWRYRFCTFRNIGKGIYSSFQGKGKESKTQQHARMFGFAWIR